MRLYKITLLFLLLPFVVFSTEKKHEKSKTIHKKFNVNEDATLYIKNKYGNVNVTTWNENRVEIDVKITVKGNSLSKVEDRLDDITVNFEATKSLVEARTRIGSNRSSWSGWFGNNNLSFTINYVVKMPSSNNADFHNSYGNIYIQNDITGKTTLDCSYGNIEAEKLLNNNNYIEIDYCGNSEIEYMKSGEINADYSKIEVDESEKIKASCDYTTLKIGKCNDVSFSSDYGSVAIKEAQNINGNSDYAGMTIGTVTKNLDINTDYGGLRVKNLAKGFENVTVKGSYSGINIGTPSDNSFDFKVDVSFANFGFTKSKVELYKSIKKTTKKYYEGTFGKANSGSKITVKSSFGGVAIRTND